MIELKSETTSNEIYANYFGMTQRVRSCGNSYIQ